MTTKKIPSHKWTHTGNRVLYVKCVKKGGIAHGGFMWPRKGFTECPKAKADRKTAATITGNEEHDCSSGALFGWPWAISIGEGKTPDYPGDWIVFAVDPQDSIGMGGKAKAVGPVEVVYYGDALGAFMFTHAGRIAWCEHNSEGEAHNTGDCSSSSNTGDRSSSSNTGDRSSSSNIGECSSSSNTGYCSSSSNTGYCSSSSNTGDRSSSSNTGDRSSSSNTGDCSSSSNTGECSSSSNTGDHSSSSNTGDHSSSSNTGNFSSSSNTGYCSSSSNTGNFSSSSNTGDRSSSSNTGYCSSSSNTGECSSSSNTGYCSSSSNTGEAGVASLTGEKGKLEVGCKAIGATTATQWRWIVHSGAVVLCRWKDENGDWPHKLLIADELGLKEGDVVTVINGEIQK